MNRQIAKQAAVCLEVESSGTEEYVTLVDN